MLGDDESSKTDGGESKRLDQLPHSEADPDHWIQMKLDTSNEQFVSGRTERRKATAALGSRPEHLIR